MGKPQELYTSTELISKIYRTRKLGIKAELN
jgi:hypothetical protein